MQAPLGKAGLGRQAYQAGRQAVPGRQAGRL